MIWFYYFIIIIVLLCPNTTIVATSYIGNQLAATDGNGNGGMKKSCFQNEKQALLNFKDSLQDPYGQLSTWTPAEGDDDDDDDCCNWSGVTCNNQTHHVTKLHLSNTDYDLDFDVALVGLGGEISHSFLNLTYLNHLDLSYNSFHGTIPCNFIASMTQLRYLDLSGNSFIGTIPNSIGSMSRLTYLSLRANSFSGTIPRSIGSMTQLRYLDLSGNSFEGTIPRSIGSLTQLRYLDLSFNSFNGTIPLEFGNLTNLRNLSLGAYEERPCTIENLDGLSNLFRLQYLKIEGISLAKANHWVDVVLSLPKLSYLSLSRCGLSEVMLPYSSFFNSSSSIEFLTLRSNNLNSSMYRWLFPLTSNRLLSLDLSENMLDGIPKYLGNLCSLTSLSFTGNYALVNFPDFLNNLSGCTSVTLQLLLASYAQFAGSLADEIQQFSSLRYLGLSHNNLNGTMSEKVWELSNLERLHISSNSLIISPNIGKSKVSYIDLSNNSLVVFPSIAHMLNLYYLESIDLSSCNLGPLFPKLIQTHKNLTRLDISDNKISDIIPIEFWDIWPSRLVYLNLSSNNISGKVQDLSSNFGLYSTIDLSSNNLYGPISIVPTTLVSLNLSKNKFYGGISFICQIVDGFLSFLDLSHNSFTGQIPDCLWQCKELRVLNLGHNNLSGRLPASIGYADRLEVLHLYNNNFLGELPLSLKNCTELKFLNLGANKFFGNVPAWVGENLTGLYVLSLRSNNFFGPIPLQLCYLMKLQILDMSMNNLDGTIPSCVSNLKALKSTVQGRLSQQNIHYPLNHLFNVTTVVGILFKYVDNAMIGWQGNEREFTGNLGFLRSIDLSSNNLTGHIPNELVDLHELVALNLSKNTLLGEIPRNIGDMKKLLTLDLSRNSFSGAIPSSMSQMASLNYLDMSYNSLSGRIPSSTQLQSFPASRYTRNVGLCGLPITKICPGDEVPPIVGENESGEEGTDELQRWFYIGGSIGFATGFWMACGALLVNHHGRHAFFPFVDFVKDWIYVKVVMFIRKLERVAHT